MWKGISCISDGPVHERDYALWGLRELKCMKYMDMIKKGHWNILNALIFRGVYGSELFCRVVIDNIPYTSRLNRIYYHLEYAIQPYVPHEIYDSINITNSSSQFKSLIYLMCVFYIS